MSDEQISQPPDIPQEAAAGGDAERAPSADEATVTGEPIVPDAPAAPAGAQDPTQVLPPAPAAVPHAQVAADPAVELAERLRALDRLYEAGEITGTELGDARRRLLAGETLPATPATAPKPPEPARVLGMPVGVAAGIGALVVVGIVALIVALALGGGDDGDASASAASGTDYLELGVNRQLGLLTNSAVAIGKSLGGSASRMSCVRSTATPSVSSMWSNRLASACRGSRCRRTSPTRTSGC